MSSDPIKMLAGVGLLSVCCISSSLLAGAMGGGGGDEDSTGNASGGSTDKTVKGVRYVRLERTTGDYPANIINLAEVEVLDNSGTNVATGKTVTGGPGGAHSAGPFERLVDDNLGNFAHTTGNGLSFLEINLGSDADVKSVKITNRGETTSASCCWNRINDVKVILLDKDKKELKTTTTIDKWDKRHSIYDFTAPTPMWKYE
jgi:hypothetical protein